jgi:hypothetical protein
MAKATQVRTPLTGSVVRVAAMAVSLLLGFASQSGGATLKELLDSYTGQWRGTTVVSTPDGRILREIAVEQQYWWKGERQHGVAVSYLDGQLSYSQSETYVQGGSLYSVVAEANGKSLRYFGRVDGRTITWVPADVLQVGQRQTRETVIPSGADIRLTSESFQIVEVDGIPKTILIRSNLLKLP